MAKAIYYSNSSKNILRVYDAQCKEQISSMFEISDKIIDRKTAIVGSMYSDVQAIFTTWGMDYYSEQEIEKYFPSLKYLFYAAGSVQHFAEPFIKRGVRVFSAWCANAIPVAEYTYAEIVLANKGMFQAVRRKKYNNAHASAYCENAGGNYKAKIGIIGVGKIGGSICEQLKALDCQVYFYDPYLSIERQQQLNIFPMTLEDLFKECDCISNHLANKKELEKILNYQLFSSMKPYATFINTGRGSQVDEKGLVKAMRQCKTRTAILDVSVNEPPSIFSRIRHTSNIVLTPHIAGSLGREVGRMGEYMVEECARALNDDQTLYEVSINMLATMA